MEWGAGSESAQLKPKENRPTWTKGSEPPDRPAVRRASGVKTVTAPTIGSASRSCPQ